MHILSEGSIWQVEALGCQGRGTGSSGEALKTDTDNPPAGQSQGPV